MKNEILKILFDAFNQPSIEENRFRMPEYHMRLNRFLTLYVSEDKQDKASAELEDLYDLCHMHSFETGFYTAVSLFLRS